MKFVWRKSVPAAREEFWTARLALEENPRAAITTIPTAKSVRIEIYGDSRRELNSLAKKFSGRVLKTLPPRFAESKPIRIRDRLLVVSSPCVEEKRRVLVIPAGMAFGTGAHATTATCLRFLCDVSAESAGKNWSLVDAGTGSGILAIAAGMLGATRIEAFDFDPAAVRVARENFRAHGIARAKLARRDITNWQPAHESDVVCANLYSEVLLRARRILTQATRSGGALIISGLLRAQEHDCVAAFSRSFRIERIVRRGKWVAFLARRIR